MVSFLSCLFSFLAANFFGRFVVKSSIFYFLSSLFGWNSDNNFLKFSLPVNSYEKGLGEVISKFNSPLSSYLIFWILIFFLFSGFKRLIKKLSFLTCLVRKIPFMNEIDGVLGGVFGAIEAVAFLFAVAGVCFLIILVTQNKLMFLNVDIINSTNLFFIFYRILPFFKFF